MRCSVSMQQPGMHSLPHLCAVCGEPLWGTLDKIFTPWKPFAYGQPID